VVSLAMLIEQKIKVIGRREFVDFPLLGIFNIESKIDTGAYTSSIHCDEIKRVRQTNDKELLCFTLLDGVTHSCDNFTTKKIKNSFGEMEERFVIKTIIHIGKKKINTTVSLTNRGSMKYPVLIGRRAIKGKFLVDVNKVHTYGLKIK